MAGTVQSRPSSADYRREHERTFGAKERGGGKSWLCTRCWQWFSEPAQPRAEHECEVSHGG